MKYPKLNGGETPDTYAMESAVTEVDVLQMAQQIAMYRLSKGRVLTERRHVFSHLKTLLQFHDYEVFALLLLDTEHRVIGFNELFRGALEVTCVSPREAVKISLEHNAAAVILVHNRPFGNYEPGHANYALTTTLKNALNKIGTQTLDHVVVGREGCISLADHGCH